jgi:hypothetical protein
MIKESKMKNLIIVCVCLPIVFFACFDGDYNFKIIDSYYIYQNQEQDYELVCKMGCKGDSIIKKVKAVHWNNRAILLETEKNNELFIIIASKQTLLCCNEDIHIGPFKQAELHKIILEYNIATFERSKSFRL